MTFIVQLLSALCGSFGFALIFGLRGKSVGGKTNSSFIGFNDMPIESTKGISEKTANIAINMNIAALPYLERLTRSVRGEKIAFMTLRKDFFLIFSIIVPPFAEHA